jgi:hypothetical protein
VYKKAATTISFTTKNHPQPSTKPNTDNYEKAVQKIHAKNIQERNNTERLRYKQEHICNT